jgi:hypothetical protein
MRKLQEELGKNNLLKFFFKYILFNRSRFREVADIPRSLQLIFEVCLSLEREKISEKIKN